MMNGCGANSRNLTWLNIENMVWLRCRNGPGVCVENLIRVDAATKSAKLAK